LAERVKFAGWPIVFADVRELESGLGGSFRGYANATQLSRDSRLRDARAGEAARIAASSWLLIVVPKGYNRVV
jgi:hypothetical protein